MESNSGPVTAGSVACGAAALLPQPLSITSSDENVISVDGQYIEGKSKGECEVTVTSSNGVSATAFAPDATCTRGQVVTFLYRAAK